MHFTVCLSPYHFHIYIYDYYIYKYIYNFVRFLHLRSSRILYFFSFLSEPLSLLVSLSPQNWGHNESALGRNRRNREIRKLLVYLFIWSVFKTKKMRLEPRTIICHVFPQYITPMAKEGHIRIQTPVALMKPRLLNPLKTTYVLSGPGLCLVTTSSLCTHHQSPLL